ncbi:MAG TPA: metallophosphoesterase family protein [Terriglobales bacterium]|nr:metallophosphoesterase family protein [Terriglobales bacterium]
MASYKGGMDAVTADTLILSDLHLGSEVSRARDALQLLRQSSFRRLILLGDIFADLNFARLKKDHWKFLSFIRKLSNPKRGVEVVWVEGNHDQGLSAVMSHLVGVRVYHEYRWSYAGVEHLAIHGHQFDDVFVNNGVLGRVGVLLYLHLQKLDLKGKRFTRSLDGWNTRWLRLSRKVCTGALAYACRRRAARVFCGHTHVALQVERDGVQYFNCGAWVSEPATFIIVSQEGVCIHEYRDASHRDPGQERGPVVAPAAGLADPPDLLPALQPQGVRG